MLRVHIDLLDLRLREWGFPRWGSSSAAGLDLHACLDAPLPVLPQAPPVLVAAGFALRIRDPDWCGLIYPRSGLGHRDGLVLGNGSGVIDADYEGQIQISVWNRNPAGAHAAPIVIAPGDRIAQMVFTRIVRPEFDIADANGVVTSERAGDTRGASGFGSTGR